ncbi:MAG: hypothetical protein HY328_10820 [Chloroflexi bacterium]|nr:hypothetical protein [Chloroflexota bacterium]
MVRRNLYIIALLALALFSGRALAQPQTLYHTPLEQSGSPATRGGFTNAAFQGNYAGIGIVGANMAGVVGVCHMDGNGRFECTFTFNVPGEEGERMVFPSTGEGEYWVNSNGTGVAHEIITLPDGSIDEFDLDFVITRAEAIGSYVVATEVIGMARQAGDPSGTLLTSHLTRLPDVGMALATSAEEMETAQQAALPPGIYTTTLAAEDIPPAFPAEAIPLLSGAWEMNFTDAGRFTVAKDDEVVVEGHYTSTQDEVVLTDERGPLACGKPGAETGRYRWQLADEMLTLTVVADECDGRAVILTAHPWPAQE